MNDQMDFRSPVSIGKQHTVTCKRVTDFKQFLFVLVRKDCQPFILSSQGHSAYTPFKLNIKAPVSDFYEG